MAAGPNNLRINEVTEQVAIPLFTQWLQESVRCSSMFKQLDTDRNGYAVAYNWQAKAHIPGDELPCQGMHDFRPITNYDRDLLDQINVRGEVDFIGAEAVINGFAKERIPEMYWTVYNGMQNKRLHLTELLNGPVSNDERGQYQGWMQQLNVEIKKLQTLEKGFEKARPKTISDEIEHATDMEELVAICYRAEPYQLSAVVAHSSASKTVSPLLLLAQAVKRQIYLDEDQRELQITPGKDNHIDEVAVKILNKIARIKNVKGELPYPDYNSFANRVFKTYLPTILTNNGRSDMANPENVALYFKHWIRLGLGSKILSGLNASEVSTIIEQVTAGHTLDAYMMAESGFKGLLKGRLNHMGLDIAPEGLTQHQFIDMLGATLDCVDDDKKKPSLLALAQLQRLDFFRVLDRASNTFETGALSLEALNALLKQAGCEGTYATELDAYALAELKAQIAHKIKGSGSVNHWNAVAAVAFTTDETTKAMVRQDLLTASQAILRTEASLGLSRISPGMMNFRQSHIGMIDAPVTQANRVDRFDVASLPSALICVGNLAGKHNFHRIEIIDNNVTLALPRISKTDIVVSISKDGAGYWIENRSSAIVMRPPQGVGSVVDQNTSNTPDALGGDIILVGSFKGVDRAALIEQVKDKRIEEVVEFASRMTGNTILAYKLP